MLRRPVILIGLLQLAEISVYVPEHQVRIVIVGVQLDRLFIMVDGLLVQSELRVALGNVEVVLRHTLRSSECAEPCRQRFDVLLFAVEGYRHITIQHAFFRRVAVHCHA